MSPKKPPSPIYSLKIILLDIKPPIWRRIQVPSSIRLCCLHTARSQWAGPTAISTNSRRPAKVGGVPEFDEFDEFNLIDESKAILANVLTSEADSMVYQYSEMIGSTRSSWNRSQLRTNL
jgi:hypothetical protein